MNPVLSVANLTVRANDDGSFLARNVTFSIKKRQIVALLGESGCGKTTVCRAIMNLLDKDRFRANGEIRLGKQNILPLSEKEMLAIRGRYIASIVQNPMTAFNPTRKIGAQIIETLHIHTGKKPGKLHLLAQEALTTVNLENPLRIMDSYPNKLSGGMLQRVVIALALALNPKIILADEPTTALDVVNQNIILQEFGKMKARGLGILLVTHDFGVALKVADEVCIMRNGEILERGAARSVLTAPKHPFTKEFISASLLAREVPP